MVLFIYRPSILYLIKIKTKRGHCTGTGDPWSHILGNTVQVHTVTRQQRNEWAMRKMVFKLLRWFEVCISGLCCQPRPRPAHTSQPLPLHINRLTQLPVTNIYQHGDLSIITYDLGAVHKWRRHFLGCLTPLGAYVSNSSAFGLPLGASNWRRHLWTELNQKRSF